MERLTLTPRHQSIDFKQYLPTEDILPSLWPNLPLGTKLPMHKTPEGSVQLFTTSLSEPKYRSNQCIDFDLSDPLGTSLSTEYQSLHDPHLKSHFNIRAMRRHLVRNEFITPSGEVICTLREFNQYRQYLRRLCLLEVTQERKEELANVEAARIKKQRPSRTELSPKFHEFKKRQQEMLAKIKQRHEELVKMEEERLQKKCQLQAEKMVNYEEKRKASDMRRDEIVYRHKQELKRKNINLLRSWIIKDHDRNKRLEEQKADIIQHQTQKNIENWQKRKLHEYEKLEREKEVREKEREMVEENVKQREKKIRKLRNREFAEINAIKVTRRRRQRDKERTYAQRLAHKIVTGNVHPYTVKGKTRSYSEYNSVWHFKEILKFLDPPDASDELNSRTTSLDFLRNCNYTVDSTAPTMDCYSGHYEGERRDSDELEFIFQESDGRRRSVRFHNDEHIIPTLLSGSTLTPGSSNVLRPVSEHVLTPVPSPIPPELLDRDSVTEEPSKGATLVETLLLRLLDDLNNQRLSRPDLETLTSYCLQVLRTHDLTSKIEEFQEQHELKRTTSSEVASELVQFTLDKMLDDVKTGSVNDDDLTTITLALVRQRQQVSPNECLESGIRDHILETLQKIGSEEGGIKAYVTKSLSTIDSEKHPDCFVAAVLSQTVADIKSGVIDSEGLKLIGSAVAAHSQTSPGTALSEAEIKSSVETFLQKIDVTDLKENNTIYAIISSYYTVNQQNREIVKDFVIEVFPKICATMKAPDSDRIKKNIKEFIKDLKERSVSDIDINQLGLQIMYVGKKCLPPTLQDICKGYKELTKNIKQVLERNEFKKEVDKVLCGYFMRDKMQRSGDSTIYTPSPESKVAINVVLGTMDIIIRDVYTRHIPPELLIALASEIYALARKCESIFDPSEEPNLKTGMSVLNRIYEKFRENLISFKDAKWMFATIFHTYIDPDSVTVLAEFEDICPNDRVLVGDLVNETINKIVQTVALEINKELSSENISLVEIEDLVREELHGLNEGGARPADLSHIEGDLEDILHGCLSKAARDIARHVEGVESVTSMESRTKLGDMCFMGKVVDFILSALDHLTQNIESGDIKSSTVIEFLNRVSGSDVKNLSPKQHQELLEEIRLNVEQEREESKYFSNIASLFSEITLDPKSTTSGLRAISQILSSIDSEVLIEFVQAAMLCVLRYIQSDQSASKDVPLTNETSFHRIESLLLVRKVLNYVVGNVSSIVKANDTKKSGSKSIFKRFSSKKLDNKDSRSLYECIICAFKDAKSSLSQKSSNILAPNVLATTDEKVLEHILDVTDLIQNRCDGNESQPVMSDELEIICEMMINSIDDMERSLEHPKEFKLAFGCPVSEFNDENIQQYVLEAIKDTLLYFYPNMVHSVASNSSRDTELHQETSDKPKASEGSTHGAPMSKVSSQAIEVMVKSVLSSVVADQRNQLDAPDSEMKKSSVTGAEGKTSRIDNENDPSLTTLKPILGTHPLDIGEDDISSALSYITMKPRATHHNPPQHEPRQSYRSLTCPDVHNYSQTKHAITSMIGTERAGSGAVVTLIEESESQDSVESSYSVESCRVLEITGHDECSTMEVPVFAGREDNLKSSEVKIKCSTIKTTSISAPKSNLSLRRGASMESELKRSKESVKKQFSFGSPAASTPSSTNRSETQAKSSSIAFKQKSSSSSTQKSKDLIAESKDQSKNNNVPRNARSSGKQLTDIHPAVTDSSSKESQRSSQNMEISSVCGSHKSSMVVRESDESVKGQR